MTEFKGYLDAHGFMLIGPYGAEQAIDLACARPDFPTVLDRESVSEAFARGRRSVLFAPTLTHAASLFNYEMRGMDEDDA